MIFTTYLARWKTLTVLRSKKLKVYFVMRNRGNNAVAPSQDLLSRYKSEKINFDEVEKGIRGVRD